MKITNSKDETIFKDNKWIITKRVMNKKLFKPIIFIVLLLGLLAYVLNEAKPGPKDTSHYRQDRAEIYYK